MYLCIDIGNTLTKLAVLDSGYNVISYQSQPSNVELNFESINAFNITKIGLSSVVAGNTGMMIDKISAKFDLPVQSIDTKCNLNFAIDMPNPDELGADLIANSAYAVHLFPDAPSVVIDLGSAITFTLINNKIFKGGLILPGLEVISTAFKAKFPVLTQNLDPSRLTYKPNFDIANTTDHAISSGLASAFYGPIIYNISQLKAQYKDLKVILTGGDGQKCHDLPHIDVFDQYITLKGIALLINKAI